MDPRLDGVLDLLSGRRQLEVGLDTQALLKLAVAVFAAMLLATILGRIITK